LTSPRTVERIEIVGLHVVLDVVVDETRPIRGWPDLGDAAGNRVDSIGRNDIASEPLACDGIVDGARDGTQVTGPHLCRWHRKEKGAALILPQALKVAEEKGLVRLNADPHKRNR
jgi:hypothetical protein